MGYWEINKMTSEDFKTFQKLIDEDIKRELKIKKEFKERNK
jgi:hypothetical protein|tara:strand:+ start:1044 stop:1166 length:123 start_codon:yes stop_codon:yes gene_type:complete